MVSLNMPLFPNNARHTKKTRVIYKNLLYEAKIITLKLGVILIISSEGRLR